MPPDGGFSTKVATFVAMLRIKRLYLFMLQSFFPVFCMTFFICLFIVLMQFLWRYIDDLVGKGLSVDVIAELFFYAALTMIPMALPLAILLASLMTFGNLGERFELTAMKAAGVSLLRAMKPLIVGVVLIAIGAFFFQNDVLPVAQTKMWTLLFSMRQKSPEMEIPEGVFYDQIPDRNIYVESKERETGTLYNMMIYDMSAGFDNARVILADSAKLSFSRDKTHLYLKMWQGELFENLRDAAGATMNNVPYRRESFTLKEMVFPFDANFNRLDEQGMRNQYVGKNIAELNATIDSVTARIDSAGVVIARELREAPAMGVPYFVMRQDRPGAPSRKVVRHDVTMSRPLDVDSVFNRGGYYPRASIVQSALSKAKRKKTEYEFRALSREEDLKTIRRHGIELQKKFTLSVACLIFFFIGAPLGAIIRKGGLGMPIVISVFLFIFYYIIDNTGFKMAREGRLEVWEGMWLSTAVLLPLGVFLTYKAVNDSAVFNADAYINFIKRVLGRGEVRQLEVKTVVIDEVDTQEALRRLDELDRDIEAYLTDNPERQNYVAYWLRGYSRSALKRLSDRLESTVEYLSNSRKRLVVMKLMDLPVLRSLWLYHPVNYRWVGWTMVALLPLGLPLWLVGLHEQKILRGELKSILKTDAQLRELLLKPEQP